jgi:peptide/nickel transport system permease protein
MPEAPYLPEVLEVPAPVAAALIFEPLPAEAEERRRLHAVRALGPGFWLPALWIIIVLVAALFAGVLPLHDPLKSDFSHVSSAPGTAGHLLGTDEIGRDILSRLCFGARVSLTVGIVAVGVGMLIGGAAGLVAGYARGRAETVIMGLVYIMLAFPALILVIAITAFLGQSLRNVTLAVATVAVPAFARVTRGATLAFADREFITAARMLGARSRRIMWRELLPNVLLPVGAFALVVVAVAIVAEGGLAFLGLSVPAPKPSWGSMISGARNKLSDGTAPFISLIPAGVLCLTVLCFNLVGDRLRRVLNVRESAL